MLSQLLTNISVSLLSNVDFIFFFFNDTATTEIYTLSLHDALPISIVVTANGVRLCRPSESVLDLLPPQQGEFVKEEDRKSTRLNSSHANISYAVFCLKKKKN